MKIKVWKYRNAFADIPKNSDMIPCTTCTETTNIFPGSLIKSNDKFILHLSQKNGGRSLCVMPIGSSGTEETFLSAKGLITDIDFNPCNSDQIITSSSEGISLFDLKQQTFACSTYSRPGDLIRPNSYVDGLVFVSAQNESFLYHFGSDKEIELPAAEAPYCGGGWNSDFGCNTMVLTTKNGKATILDVRTPSISLFDLCYKPGTNSALWFSANYVLTSGFSQISRTRQLTIFDVRNTSKALSATNTTSGSNSYRLLYDSDTEMLFSYCRGENSLIFLQLEQTNPCLTQISSLALPSQIKDVSMTGKQALNVMECELNRLNVLTANSIIPLSYKLSRKFGGEFSPELFPNTCALKASQSLDEWLSCSSFKERPKVSLRPGDIENDPLENIQDTQQSNHSTQVAEETTIKSKPKVGVTPTFISKIVDVSVYPTYTHITKIQNSEINMGLHSTSLAISCSLDSKKPQFFAIPVGKTSSRTQVRILPINKFGRADDNSTVNIIERNSSVSEIALDPHNSDHIAIGYIDSTIAIYKISQDVSSHELIGLLEGHSSKINILLYNQYGRNILASSDTCGNVAIWNSRDLILLSKITVEDQCLAMSWSYSGYRLCCFEESGHLSLYTWENAVMTLKSKSEIKNAKRWGRCCWSGNDKFIVLSTYSNQTQQRVLLVVSVGDDLKELDRIELGDGASPIRVFLDVDTNIIILSSKGEATIYLAYLECTNENRVSLQRLKGDSVPRAYQQLALLHKCMCNVKKVEVVAGYLFTGSSIEKISFAITRYRPEYFQDDIFKPTAVLWEPTVSTDEWIQGVQRKYSYLNLAPAGMTYLSNAPEIKRTNKYESYCKETYLSENDKLNSMFDSMCVNTMDDTARHLDDDENW